MELELRKLRIKLLELIIKLTYILHLRLNSLSGNKFRI